MRIHVDLLKRVMVANAQVMPVPVLKQMKDKLMDIVTMLMVNGPYANPLQLPQHYVPALTALPWHNATLPIHQEAIRILRQHTAPLADEYAQLRDRGLMVRERECIHDITQGHWRRFEITGHWVNKTQEDCAAVTPVACSVLRQLRAIGLPVIRVGLVPFHLQIPM